MKMQPRPCIHANKFTQPKLKPVQCMSVFLKYPRPLFYDGPDFSLRITVKMRILTPEQQGLIIMVFDKACNTLTYYTNTTLYGECA